MKIKKSLILRLVNLLAIIGIAVIISSLSFAKITMLIALIIICEKVNYYRGKWEGWE